MSENELYIPRGYFSTDKVIELVPNGAAARWAAERAFKPAVSKLASEPSEQEVLDVPEFLRSQSGAMQEKSSE